MKKIILLVGFLAFACESKGELSGITALACQAILCLSTSARPSECNPSTNYYYGLKARTMPQTISKRLDFLNLCPVSSSSRLGGWISAIANGAGRCDAQSLNSGSATTVNGKVCASNAMPSYCTAYAGDLHAAGNIKLPVFVKDPPIENSGNLLAFNNNTSIFGGSTGGIAQSIQQCGHWVDQ